ncbi:uncharacterized protein LOC127717259 isoform X32 [Mytilus californianus]|uniref:uncharacterized protein LOC127717259 isoform X32 n=1 Tax=Mytilus californianus TaxID=6549 RepID=UPI002246D9C6|nr:uncharacterized protein LOC127717259 isoform X32 [Mytilus californianus]
MASNALSPEEENYVRMALLLTGISPRAVRVLFDKEFPPASLSSSINTTTTKATLNNLKRRKVINKKQWDLLFPTSGTTDSKTFDVTLMIALLRNLPTSTLVPPVNGYDNLPVTTEAIPASDLARIKHYRNLLAHLHDSKVDGTLFTTAWKDLSDAVLRLGGNKMKQECDQLITKQLDASSQEILQAKKDIETIERSLDLIKADHTKIKKDIITLKSGRESFKKSCHLPLTESKKGIMVLKSDHKSLKRSHDLLQHEQTVSKKDGKRVKKELKTLQFDQIKAKQDVKTLHLDHDSLKISHSLLQVEQTVSKKDIVVLKSDHKSLKRSLTSDHKSFKGSLKSDHKSFKGSLKSDHKSLKRSLKSDHKSLRRSLKSDHKGLRRSLKSDHKSLKRSHDLLQKKQTVSIKDGKRVKKDVKSLKLDHDSLKKSHGLLEVDQKEMRIDVQNVKSDCDILKTSQALIQSDQIKTKEDVKKLTSISEDPVPWNRRVIISKLLDEWQKNADNFVETRAAKCVLKCIKENSCLTITASSGVGKTSILHHVALKMKGEGFDILPVTNPNDIIQFYNPNQKTLFVIDDICGTYSINQSDLDSWESVMEQIKMLIENKFTKIIVACRLQVYQDEKFESLSIFRTCVCNMQSGDLCLIQKEKTSIAELYLETKATEIIQYCNLYDCFPLLCKLYSDNPELNITNFFKNPFFVYETEIDRLYKKGHNTKYCAMALCVMFNNNLKEELFTEEINVETRMRIEKTCEACRLDRGTSRIFLLDELNSLEHTFIKKEKGVFKTIHDNLFDFLAYYFGQNMIQCLIKNAHSVVIMQRFLLERKDDMDQFITIVPPKYHQMYMQRMIDDWSIGRLDYVFKNINFKIQEFRHRFLCYLKKFVILFQRRLALKINIINSKETALILCCYYGDIPFIHWCINHGVCVNLCDCRGVSPLHVGAIKGHKETVKVLLDNKADINKCTDNGASPLYAACRMNHKEIVKILLDNNADINKCLDNGASPLHIACQNNHIETLKVLLDNNADINKCLDNGASPLHIACQNNHKETLRVLLDNKADINKCDDNGVSPLHIACQNNHIETVKVLLNNNADINKCKDNGVSPLYLACQNNHIETVKVLLNNNADINKCKDNGVSPLYLACQNNHIETVKVLLNNNADINKCNDNGVSPLHIACQNNHIETVKVLLNNNADINKCKDNGVSPLYLACQNNHIETVKVLLNNNADINKCNDNGVSPLHIACQNNHIETVKVLLNNNADINKCKDNGVSPLYLACQNNHIETVKVLLNNNADINKCNDNGVSPLHIACQNNHIETVKVLLDNNADINKCDDNGVSPLHIACQNNHIETVKVLLDNKANINKCTNNGISPKQIARENRYNGILAVIKEYSREEIIYQRK